MRLFHAFTLAAAGGDMKARVLLGTLAVVGATTTARRPSMVCGPDRPRRSSMP